jgi:hypothetical protein
VRESTLRRSRRRRASLSQPRSFERLADQHRTGSVYDLYAAPKDAARPANEWNQTRIVARGSHVEHWLNGKNVASYEVGSPDWHAAIKASKFNSEKYPNFGKAPKGYLGIQGDHPGTLELRNIRIRELQ